MDKNTLLLRAVAQYLQRCGFPKALKQFCKEANIQKDELGTTSFDLQDIFYKYLDKSDPSAKNLECNSLLDSNTSDKHVNVDVETTLEAVNSRNKKRSDKSDAKADNIVDSKISEEIITNDVVPVEVKPKEKSKKKSEDKEINKKDSDSNEHDSKLVEETAKSIVDDSADLKHKKKKSKREKSNVDSQSVGERKLSVEETITNDVLPVEVKPKEKSKTKSKDKEINKRDLDSNGHNSKSVEETAKTVVDDSADLKHNKKKSKKEKSNMDSEAVGEKKAADPETVDEPKEKKKNKKKNKSLSDPVADIVVQQEKDTTNKSEKYGEEKNIKDDSASVDLLSTDMKEIDPAKSNSDSKKNVTSKEDVIQENRDSKKRKRLPYEDDATQPDQEKAADESKRRKIDASKNGSVEPKVPNRFQRVKVDDVVFTDERLKDNSYWAKDGAENGYGAKAQEVLGQVRGRNFRHEKTKKKRGSYRGGQIDLQSHSVKFTFPDDD